MHAKNIFLAATHAQLQRFCAFLYKYSTSSARELPDTTNTVLPAHVRPQTLQIHNLQRSRAPKHYKYSTSSARKPPDATNTILPALVSPQTLQIQYFQRSRAPRQYKYTTSSARKPSGIESAIALGRCIWLRKWLGPDLDIKTSK